MHLEEQKYVKNCYSITNDETEPAVVWQPSQEIHKHQVDKGYLILSKNDFGKIKKRINLGYFNKKTNFIVGENNSLIWWDTKTKSVASGNIQEIIKEPKRYFLMYDLNFITDDDHINNMLHITDKNTSEVTELQLTNQFGRDIGELLLKSNPTTITIPEDFDILNSIIETSNSRLSLNKQVLINSNPSFLMGILEGYIDNEKNFILKNNINIYNFTYILNLLGAQYSIRSVQNNEKQIRFRLPAFLKKQYHVSTLASCFFRSWKYYFNEDHELNIERTRKPEEIAGNSLFEIVNSGLIEMVPVKDLVFIETNDEVMYDLTMSRADATNFSLPGTFYMKNSDGDVLGVVAIHSEDAAKECIRKFSTELKENFLSLSTGDVNSWGVKLDAQTGLYTATK